MEADVDAEPTSLRLAVSLYGIRRKRDAAADRKWLFGEPGWDILLDLFIAEQRRSELQVSSVCLDASVPSTTILRWIGRLERDGLIYRVADHTDARRRYVKLTDRGRDLMQSVFSAIGKVPA